MKERIKSWALALLVMFSMFLTWQLWTFQPNFAPLNESAATSNEEIGEERSLNDVIEPSQLVFHEGVSYTALNGTNDLFARFYDELLDSQFQNMTVRENVSRDSLYEAPRTAEIIFPASVPDEVLSQMFQFEEEDPGLPINSVDRMILRDQGGNSENLLVTFASNEESFVLQGETTFSMSSFRENYILQMDEYKPVFPYDPGNQSSSLEVLYLPENSVEYSTLSDTSTDIDYNQFLNLLFSDAEYVEQYRRENGEASFTDGNRMVSVEENGTYFQYVNPVYSEGTSSSQRHVIDATFGFVNSRGGWTDDYRLYDWQPQSEGQHATYRMIVSGLPVFTSGGPDISSINVTRSGGQISEYSRPLFELDDSPIDARGSIELASGREVVEYAEQQFDPSLIEDIQPGYQLEKTDSLVFRFEPSWYVKHDGAWYPVDPDDTQTGSTPEG
ncbi:YycH family regulatory protein [Salibacterium qingdaonense]|uniref:Two-component signal transduction system YycFG, regulatory protein YycH n=1 Tax=Salibacterium qingdaonense TaxID=266892 RepID=A0A1I4NB75_9BACI|nr:two-component system activity regulator YycH [Salibacterium qingdaonense]SFM12812.1 Two-component signal transduction system YycFG, regulatory protein YycH [Salibacterium qingdaonense]